MNFLPKNYDLEASWKVVQPPFEHPDFVTHANYLQFMSEYSKNLKLSCNINIKNTMKVDKKLEQKVKLLSLTLDNLKEELNNIKKFPEYSIVCVSWVPVKSYYLFFHLLVILEYLATTQDIYLTASHERLFKQLKIMLREEELSFENKIFNQIHTTGKALAWHIPQWENVKRRDADPIKRYKQIIKILSRYSKEEFKRKRNIKRLSGEKKIEFEKTNINLCEFLYWYRIKANYRDMEFIDSGVEVQEFVNFYNDYFDISMNFYLAFKECINEIATKRIGKNLLIRD